MHESKLQDHHECYGKHKRPLTRQNLIFINKSIVTSISHQFVFEHDRNTATIHHHHPVDGAHLVAVRGLIHQEVPEYVNEESSTERRS